MTVLYMICSIVLDMLGAKLYEACYPRTLKASSVQMLKKASIFAQGMFPSSFFLT